MKGEQTLSWQSEDHARDHLVEWQRWRKHQSQTVNRHKEDIRWEVDSCSWCRSMGWRRCYRKHSSRRSKDHRLDNSEVGSTVSQKEPLSTGSHHSCSFPGRNSESSRPPSSDWTGSFHRSTLRPLSCHLRFNRFHQWTRLQSLFDIRHWYLCLGGMLCNDLNRFLAWGKATGEVITGDWNTDWTRWILSGCRHRHDCCFSRNPPGCCSPTAAGGRPVPIRRSFSPWEAARFSCLNPTLDSPVPVPSPFLSPSPFPFRGWSQCGWRCSPAGLAPATRLLPMDSKKAGATMHSVRSQWAVVGKLAVGN